MGHNFFWSSIRIKIPKPTKGCKSMPNFRLTGNEKIVTPVRLFLTVIYSRTVSKCIVFRPNNTTKPVPKNGLFQPNEREGYRKMDNEFVGFCGLTEWNKRTILSNTKESEGGAIMKSTGKRSSEEDRLLQDGVHTIEAILADEIKHILERNQDEKFLRSLLTRARILEELRK